jgi:aspartate aminotransferase
LGLKDFVLCSVFLTLTIMSTEQLSETQAFPVSRMAETLHGSEIIKLAAEINEKIKAGARIYNFTIGDFDPDIFPIPTALRDEIIQAYIENQTNYPAANGIAPLRASIASYTKSLLGLDYSPDDFLVAGGARPIIYAAYHTLVDPGDKVVFPVPSWNSNHYAHLSRAVMTSVETKPENNFMPTAEELKPHLKGATLLSLCSPLNPTGTTFTRDGLFEICKLVLEENLSRPVGSKPLYLLYDQIYSALTYGDTVHHDPVSLLPELRPYTVFVDGLSKTFAATGVRVGWGFGPSAIIDKMKSIVGHVGAWSPKPEQVATAVYLADQKQAFSFINTLKDDLQIRLDGFYKGFESLENEGFPVTAIAPQAALYLTVKFDLTGKRKKDGTVLKTTADVTKYLLDEAGVAIVPFYAFGSSVDSSWYRLSVGTCKVEQIAEVVSALRNAMGLLS